MPRPRHIVTPRRLLGAVVVLLLAASLSPARLITPIANVPRWVVQVPVGPPSALLRSLGAYLRPADYDPATPQSSPEQLGRQLALARQEIRNLEKRVADLQRENARLARAREQGGDELAGIRMVDARVSGVSGSELKPVLTIARGQQHGIREGQAVVFWDSLVGEVEMVGPLSAEVRLITAAETGLAVELVPPVVDAARKIQAWAELSENRTAFIAETARQRTVKVGDLAHLRDDGWPAVAQGFVVGKVTDVRPKKERPLELQRVTIKPQAPLRQLDRVTILVPRE